MKVRVVSRVTIAAGPNKIFKYLADSSYHFLWNPHLQTLTPMGKLKVGSKYTTTSLVLGVRLHSEILVTKFTPNEEIQLVNNTGLLKYDVSYRLQPGSKTTQVIYTTAFQSDSKAFAFSKPILKLLAKRELQTDLQALKIAVEHNLE